MSDHCTNCGEPVDKSAAVQPEEIEMERGWEQKGPVRGGGSRVYCTLGCAALKQGWAYE